MMTVMSFQPEGVRRGAEPTGRLRAWDDSGAVVVERDRLALLHRDHYTSLVRLATLVVGDVGLAEQLTQDAFVKLHMRWGGLRQLDRAPAYLRSAVPNGARSHLRRRKVSERHDARRTAAPASMTPESSALGHAERERAGRGPAPPARAPTRGGGAALLHGPARGRHRRGDGRVGRVGQGPPAPGPGLAGPPPGGGGAVTDPIPDFETRVQAALAAEADAVRPGDGSLDAIRTRARAARRRRRAAVAGAGMVALVAIAVAVPLLDGASHPDVSTGSDDNTPAPTEAPDPTAEAPDPTTSTTPTTTATTATTASSEPAYEFGSQPLWPFRTRAEADQWLTEGAPGGHQPWHDSADETALLFTQSYLGFAEIDQVTTREVGATEAWIGVGYVPEPGADARRRPWSTSSASAPTRMPRGRWSAPATPRWPSRRRGATGPRCRPRSRWAARSPASTRACMCRYASSRRPSSSARAAACPRGRGDALGGDRRGHRRGRRRGRHGRGVHGRPRPGRRAVRHHRPARLSSGGYLSPPLALGPCLPSPTWAAGPRPPAGSLATASTAAKDAALLAAADLLVERTDDLLAANAADVDRGRAAGASPTVVDRLRLDRRPRRGHGRRPAPGRRPARPGGRGDRRAGSAPTACASARCGCPSAWWRSSTRTAPT